MQQIEANILEQAEEAVAPLQEYAAASVGKPPVLTPQQVQEFDVQYGESIAQGKIQDVLNDAVQGHNSADVEYLLNRGAKVNGGDPLNTRDIPNSEHYYVDSEGALQKPPIVMAAERNDTAMIGLLLSHNADIEARDEFGRTSLQIALNRKDDVTAGYLMDKHASVASTDPRERNGVHYAATGSEQILDRVLREGGNIPEVLNKQDVQGDTPLASIASHIRENYRDAFQGAPMNANARMLLHSGASVDPAGDNRILSSACRHGNEALVDLLLEYNANPSGRSKPVMLPAGNVAVGGNTPLMDMAGWGQGDVLKSMRIADKLLAVTGTDINAGNDEGKTALMNAVHARNLPMTSYLLAKGADINKPDNNGKTAVDQAQFDRELKNILNYSFSDAMTPMEQFLKDVRDGKRIAHNPLTEPDSDIMPKRISSVADRVESIRSSAGKSPANANVFSGLSPEDRAMIARMAAVTGNGAAPGDNQIAALSTPSCSSFGRLGTLSV